MKHLTEDSIRKEVKKTSRVIRSKTLTYLVTGLSLVAGLAWNDAIKVTIDYLLPNTGNGIIAKIFYAFTLTLFIGFILVYLEKHFEDKPNKKSKK